MKALPLAIMIPAALAIASCDMMNRPINSTGSFDPLSRPGSGLQNGPSSYGPELSPGSFVTASIPNTAFFKNRPKGSEDADKVLSVGTNMKIVSSDPDYVKVELDSGEVGWVPSVMIAAPITGPENYPMDGSYEIYPPLPEGQLEPLPIIDPSGLPPGGSIPTIIDPDAPIPAPGADIKIDPIPDLKPKEEAEKPKDGDAAPE